MFNEFKSLELFRHQVASRVDRSIKRYSEQNKTNADDIGGTVTSAFFSFLIAYLGKDYLNRNDLKSAISIFIIFICIYVLIFNLYKISREAWKNFSYNFKRNKTELTQAKIKELIDDFDHIACDNNLIAKGFIKAFENEKDENTKEFYFYEVLYYAEVAAGIAERITSRPEDCINTLNTNKHVDLHRIKNQLDMLEDAHTFLLNNITDNCLADDDNLRSVILYRISVLKQTIDKCNKKCKQFLEEHFSDRITEENIKEFKEDYMKRKKENTTQEEKTSEDSPN